MKRLRPDSEAAAPAGGAPPTGRAKRPREDGQAGAEGGPATTPPLIGILLQLAQETRRHLRFHEQFPEAPGAGGGAFEGAASAGDLGIDTCGVYGMDCEAVVTSDRSRALARVSIVEAAWPGDRPAAWLLCDMPHCP